MKLDYSNFKIYLGGVYLVVLFLAIYFLFSTFDLKDLTSYEFIRLNKDTILEYKRENFLALTTIFFVFCIIWVLLLGFAMPLLIFSF